MRHYSHVARNPHEVSRNLGIVFGLFLIAAASILAIWRMANVQPPKLPASHAIRGDETLQPPPAPAPSP